MKKDPYLKDEYHLPPLVAYKQQPNIKKNNKSFRQEEMSELPHLPLGPEKPYCIINTKQLHCGI
jgi:hypothetical protein